jgi:hypothetical protein
VHCQARDTDLNIGTVVTVCLFVTFINFPVPVHQYVIHCIIIYNVMVVDYLVSYIQMVFLLTQIIQQLQLSSIDSSLSTLKQYLSEYAASLSCLR